MKSSLEIYAELSKKQYNLIQKGYASIEIPNGVTMKNKNGSRSLYFNCENQESYNELIDGLDASGINWQ
jgi:hypothetical protein